jgi:hypothetical protein
MELIEDYIEDAITHVEAWDLPEEDFAQAVMAQAQLMAGISLDTPDPFTTIAVHAHLHG